MVLLSALVAHAVSAYRPHGGDALLRQRDYEDTVCSPLTVHADDTVPPCVEIQTIETVCAPNGTAPLYLVAHAECMCGGSFFTEWPACLQCLYLHGLRSERDVSFYSSVIAAASSALCGTATPTADFQAIFSSAQAAIPQPTTGATVSSDQAPSQTAVSLYYTATGPQGPGPITGSAALATATGLDTAGGAPPKSEPLTTYPLSGSEAGTGAATTPTGQSGSSASLNSSGGSSTSSSSTSTTSTSSSTANNGKAVAKKAWVSLLVAAFAGIGVTLAF